MVCTVAREPKVVEMINLTVLNVVFIRFYLVIINPICSTALAYFQQKKKTGANGLSRAPHDPPFFLIFFSFFSFMNSFLPSILFAWLLSYNEIRCSGPYVSPRKNRSCGHPPSAILDPPIPVPLRSYQLDQHIFLIRFFGMLSESSELLLDIQGGTYVCTQRVAQQESKI